MPLAVKLFPAPAGTITGNAVVCQGQTGLVYSVPPVTGSGSILWTLPTGATITSGAGSFTMKFSHYEPIPAHIAQKVIDETKKERELREKK